MIQFKEAADQIKQEGPRELTVRQLLGLFGQRRRGRHVMAQIRRALKRENLVTSPSFEAAHMDAPILLQPKITELRKEENMAELATSGRPVTSEDRKGIVQFKQVAEQIRQEGPKELTVRQL